MNMTTDESRFDPLAVYAAHSFADDQSYQVSYCREGNMPQADSSKAGLSALYSSGALDDLAGEAREDFLRRSRVFYFNQWALFDLFGLYIQGQSPSEPTGLTYPNPMLSKQKVNT